MTHCVPKLCVFHYDSLHNYMLGQRTDVPTQRQVVFQNLESLSMNGTGIDDVGASLNFTICVAVYKRIDLFVVLLLSVVVSGGT